MVTELFHWSMHICALKMGFLSESRCSHSSLFGAIFHIFTSTPRCWEEWYGIYSVRTFCPSLHYGAASLCQNTFFFFIHLQVRFLHTSLILCSQTALIDFYLAENSADQGCFHSRGNLWLAFCLVYLWSVRVASVHLRSGTLQSPSQWW